MRVLGIESSCDECSFAIVEDNHIVEMIVYSQLEHAPYGGVVPEIASRVHIQYISVLYFQLCTKLGIASCDMGGYIDGIAVTVCPGLSGSLMVGLNFAKGLAMAYKKPLVGIDHIQAHFYSGQLVSPLAYPYIGVVVSGGHTLIAIVHDYDVIEIKGRSIDDACGEAFEKIARALSINIPIQASGEIEGVISGGAAIDILAREEGDMFAYDFPVYSVKKYGYNVSYSGLKTAVLHHRKKYLRETSRDNWAETPANIVASFQRAAITMIIERVRTLIDESGIKRVSLGGGVACNSYFRAELMSLKDEGLITQLVIPPPAMCTDNAGMIAGLGSEYLKRGYADTLDIGVSARKSLYRVCR